MADGRKISFIKLRDMKYTVTSEKRSGDEMDMSCHEVSGRTWSPWIRPSPLNRSPRIAGTSRSPPNGCYPREELIGSITRSEGHIYSLATAHGLLYTGSDSKNIHAWKNLEERCEFKSGSRFVKAIVIAGQNVFTGHHDGKIRVWKILSENCTAHRRIGSLPSMKAIAKNSIHPKNYLDMRGKYNSAGRIKHSDAVSCLSLNLEMGLLYSGSWDRTLRVWRISNSTCLERICAHDDAVNSVVAAFGDLVFSGSADGSAKVWRRRKVALPQRNKTTRHLLVHALMKQENAVTSLAVNEAAGTIYCGTSDGLVNFWAHNDRALSHGGILHGHKVAVLCVATAGRLVFSGSADSNICAWRRENDGAHMFLSLLTGHTGPVKCLAVGEDVTDSDKADSRWVLFSGSWDRTVNIWLVAEGARTSHQQEEPKYNIAS